MIYRNSLIGVLFVLISAQLEAHNPSEAKFVRAVSQTNLQKTVRELVGFGHRLGGTQSGNKSAAYISKKFLEYGYKPEIIEDPEKLTYSNHSWSLKVIRPKRLRGLIQYEWLAGYSPSVLSDTAELIFINNVDKIDEDQIRGNAVLLETNPSEEVYQKLVMAGAKCILNFQAHITSAYSNWAMISTLKETDNNPIPLYNISNASGNRLREELEDSVKITIRFSAKTTIKMGNPKTVVATLNGISDDYYIICAHGDSDSGGPGADDNASGVSAVLEIAKIFKSLVRTKKLPIPNYSIKFIIWGSECFSSSNYVKANADRLDKILGVINIDEVGIGKSRNCIYFEGNDVDHNSKLLTIFQQVGEDYVGKKGFWKESTTCPSQSGIETRSILSLLRELLGGYTLQGSTDSYVFLPKYLKELNVPSIEIPSITVFTAAWNKPNALIQTAGWNSKAWYGHPDTIIIDYSPYYHSSLDLPCFTTDKEPANMVWAVNVVGISLLRILWQ